MSMTGARHVGLSVTDVDRAVWWCTTRLGLGFQEWPAEMTGPRTNFLYDIMEANQGGGRLLVHPETGLCLGLTPATVPGRFSPDVPGLDHLSFGVHDLQAQVDRSAGTVEHGQPTYMEEVGLTASVRGPDGIQLEYTAAPAVSAGVLHHLRLTVEDVTASRRFYEALGFQAAPLPSGSPLLLGGVLMAHPTGLLLGLRPAWEAAEFDPGRVGLNYLSFEVATEEALHALATGLARIGCRGTTPSRVAFAEIAGLRTTDPSGIPVSLIAQL